KSSGATRPRGVDAREARRADLGMMPRPLLFLLAALVACAEGQGAPESAALAALPSPAAIPSGEPFLASDANGGVHLTWLEKSGDSTYALRYATLDGDTWSATRTIAERRDFFVNWADFPSVTVTRNGTLVAHWLQRRAGGKYSYDVMITRSADSGRTWSEGQVLHR